MVRPRIYRDAHGMNHKGFRVVKVERVEYAAAYFAYSAARANTHSGDFNRTDVDIFGSLGHPSPNHPIWPPPDCPGRRLRGVNALSLLRVAHRFDMPPLEEMCQGILIDGIKVGTVAEILEVADTLNCKALRAACMDFVVAYAPPKGLTQKVLFSAPCSPSLVGATT